MNKDVFILGASGFAKEVYSLIQSVENMNVKAFVDIENGKPIYIFKKEISVISEEVFLNQYNSSNARLAMGIGEPQIIKKLSEKFKDFDFPNIVHPQAQMAKEEIVMGTGNIITAGVIMTVSIRIGNFNVFNLSTTVGHDVVIGDFNVVNPSVNISGNVQIGNGNLLGVGSIILQNKKIGNNSIIGGASLVTKDVQSDIVVIGIPAKQITK